MSYTRLCSIMPISNDTAIFAFMKRAVIVAFLIVLFNSLRAQNILKVLVKNEDTREVLAGASVFISNLNTGSATDSTGLAVIKDLPDGDFIVEVSFIGYTTTKQKITLPYSKGPLEVELEPGSAEDNPEIVVTTTRTDRSIRNTPTRVEVIAGGEISENVSMRPGEIKMLLNETTGIITQQTSAISNTANIRIQELDGRYTQVLRDGFPLYSGLSEGLSLVQIAPLDLKQVEIIKGSSSTLYGGGAIAGLINLISKSPGENTELNFLANGTSAKGLDMSGFYSEKYGSAGLTLFASRNIGAPYDPAGIGLTAIPKFRRYTITPRLFLYGKKTNANLGFGYITEKRLGGNMNYVIHGTPGYFENNQSERLTTQASITHQLNENSSLTFKNSYNHFKRQISIPTYLFEGIQQSSFSEISWNSSYTNSQWVAGLNFYSDDFKETRHSSMALRNYHYNTLGSFVQNTWSPLELFNIETGLRADYTNPYGVLLLPRISFLFHLSGKLTSRIGGGLGYKLPTIFTEESEEKQFQNILPVIKDAVTCERSVGGNLDLNYRTGIDELKITINPLLFYTRINHPLVLNQTSNDQKQFINANGYTDSKGMDLSVRLTLNELKFFTGYSYTIAQNHFNGMKSNYPLAPKHRLHFDMVYELEGKLRAAFESYYTSKQPLTDGSIGKGYWLLGALVEKSWKHFSIFINGEDLNDVRQTRWDSIYTGTIDHPDFRDIYTPLEGITINGGIKIKLY
jgi:outer membrane receptor for ferrienterochelin and colicins